MMDPTEWRPYEADANEGSWKQLYSLVISGREGIELQPLSSGAAADEAWHEGVDPEDAAEARELDAMSDRELDAELAEELGPVKRWIQEHVAQAEFSNELYPDLIDIDDARHALDAGQEPPI